MCAAEKNVILQNSLKCNHIESMAEQCIDYAIKHNKSILASFEGWRIITNCRNKLFIFVNSNLKLTN
jgi:hypothetical protein